MLQSINVSSALEKAGRVEMDGGQKRKKIENRLCLEAQSREKSVFCSGSIVRSVRGAVVEHETERVKNKQKKKREKKGLSHH